MDIKVNTYNSHTYRNAVFMSVNREALEKLLSDAFKVDMDFKISSTHFNLSWEGNQETSISLDNGSLLKYTYSKNKVTIFTLDRNRAEWHSKVFKLLS